MSVYQTLVRMEPPVTMESTCSRALAHQDIWGICANKVSLAFHRGCVLTVLRSVQFNDLYLKTQSY